MSVSWRRANGQIHPPQLFGWSAVTDGLYRAYLRQEQNFHRRQKPDIPLRRTLLANDLLRTREPQRTKDS